MQMSGYPDRMTFGLLPEPEGRSTPFLTSATVNLIILGLALYVGMTAKHVIQEHKFEQTELIFPTTPPPQPKFKTPPPPKLPDLPKPKLEMQLDQPKIRMPKIEPKPALKPLEMEAKLNTPQMKAAKPAIILAPQPKAALTAAMPAQDSTVKASTKPVHLGETFGVTPNPNASRPATVAAIGNPYGGMQGPAIAPHGHSSRSQVGAFRQIDNAERLRERIQVRFGPVVIQSFDRGNGMFHRVRVGQESTEEGARVLANQLQQAGFAQEIFVVRLN